MVNDNHEDRSPSRVVNAKNSREFLSRRYCVKNTARFTKDLQPYHMMASPFQYIPSDLVASYENYKQQNRMFDKEELLEAKTSHLRTRSDSSRRIVAAAVQITGAGLSQSDAAGFIRRSEEAIVQAVEAGANLILLPELWSGPYFCQSQEGCLMDLADPVDSNVLIQRMQKYAKKYQVVLPVSFFERENNVLYNSVAMIDADGSNLGVYRKSHIPDGTGYQEKFYFSPGDSGFKVFSTAVGKVGVAICWDQWFPESARAMALQGADVLLYPTAIGSEPQDPTLQSADHWQRVMQGHAAGNMVPVIASNRCGTEILLHPDGTEKQRIHFYGRSFVTDQVGELSDLREDPNSPIQVKTTEIDPEANRKNRLAWGLFRDRRPDLYGVLLTKDGKAP